MVLHINGTPLWNENVYVGRSKQRDSKWGLFASRHFTESKDNWILEFKGDLVREESFNKTIQDRGYYVLFSRSAVDAQIEDGYCSPVVIINVDPFTDKSNYLDRMSGFAVQIFGRTTNAVARQECSTMVKPNPSDTKFYKIYLYPTRVIKEDEEIVWEYAETYFCGSNELIINED